MMVFVVEGQEKPEGVPHKQNVKNVTLTDRHSQKILGWVMTYILQSMVMTEGLTLLRTVIHSAVL